MINTNYYDFLIIEIQIDFPPLIFIYSQQHNTDPTDPILISKDYKVLVVDDEDEVREMIRRILRFSNYQVIEARDGDEGLQKAVDEKPDLITLDIMMPGKDGFRLCAELKQHAATKHIPVVVLTVAGSRKKAMNAGADYYMNKLFSIDEFVKVINKLVGRRPSELPSA